MDICYPWAVTNSVQKISKVDRHFKTGGFLKEQLLKYKNLHCLLIKPKYV